MMTYYVGKEYLEYEKKLKEIFRSLAVEMERKGIKVTKAACFRFMIDKIYDSLNKNEEAS